MRANRCDEGNRISISEIPTTSHSLPVTIIYLLILEDWSTKIQSANKSNYRIILKWIDQGVNILKPQLPHHTMAEPGTDLLRWPAPALLRQRQLELSPVGLLISPQTDSRQPGPAFDHPHSTKALHERCSSLLITKEPLGVQIKTGVCFFKHKTFCLIKNRSGSNYDFSFLKSRAFDLDQDHSYKILTWKRKEHKIIAKLIGLSPSFTLPPTPEEKFDFKVKSWKINLY